MFLEGLLTEVVGLLFCIIIGLAVAGVCITESDSQNWPNAEMESRGIPHNLISGLAIAIPSGIGVATSLTDVKGSTAGLIGVAISAALLPPPILAFCTQRVVLTPRRNPVHHTPTPNLWPASSILQ